jgi:hypothetical protein
MREESGKAPAFMALVGPVAWYVGLLVALGAAFVTPSGWLYVALAIIGVIVGLLNITAKETGPFLFASVAFIIAALGMAFLISAAAVAAPGSVLAPLVTIPPELLRLAANITVLVGAGAMVISLRAIYELAKAK